MDKAKDRGRRPCLLQRIGEWIAGIGIGLFVTTWVPIMAFLFYLGFTESWNSARFFYWEGWSFVALGCSLEPGLDRRVPDAGAPMTPRPLPRWRLWWHHFHTKAGEWIAYQHRPALRVDCACGRSWISYR